MDVHTVDRYAAIEWIYNYAQSKINHFATKHLGLSEQSNLDKNYYSGCTAIKPINALSSVDERAIPFRYTCQTYRMCNSLDVTKHVECIVLTIIKNVTL